MKSIIVLLAMNIMMMSTVLGQQNELILTNKRTHQIKTLQQGKRIKILKTDGEKIKGKLIIINDSIVSINETTFSLSEIEKIRIKTLFSKIAGGTVTTGGTGFMILGTLLIAQTSPMGGYGSFFGVALGIPTISAGILIAGAGIAILASGKNFKKVKWNYSIRFN